MFQITPIPAFNDNYIWAIADPEGPRIAVVDPGDANAVLDYLERGGLELAAILVTHHHADHTGGVNELARRFGVPVFGPASSPFRGIDHPLSNGDQVELFGQTLAVREVPAHTLDHISYFVAGEPSQLLCGDTLFLAGCGRLFEGTALQMQQAMDYFRTLPDDTEVYCTHEYSLSNLAFAAAVEPQNSAVQDAIERCRQLREDGQPTLPSRIGSEKLINPFMRTDTESVRLSASKYADKTLSEPVDVLAAIREWKNHY